MSHENLVRGAERTASTADSLGQVFARELGAVLRAVERRLRPLIVKASEGSRTSVIRAAAANRVRTEIRGALDGAGYDNLADTAWGDRLDGLVEDVLGVRRLAKQTARLSGAFEFRLAALRSLHVIELLDEGDSVSSALWQAVIRGVFNAQPPDKILADLAAVLDARESRIATLYDTAVSIYGRQVEALQAGDDPDTPFAYMGPADKKTRPFCREHVGRVYTRAEIDALDNGQLDNVFLTGGGYNCRHTWVEVSKFSELIKLLGTEDRIPEVEAQLAELEEAA